MPTRPDVAAQVRRPLDALNFFLADVRDGLGPYLAIYLLTVQRWDEASIGVVMSIATLAGLLAQTPAGALVDATRAKRALVAGAALVVTIASLVLPWVPSFWPVARRRPPMPPLRSSHRRSPPSRSERWGTQLSRIA